jgi:hypothetical protein
MSVKRQLVNAGEMDTLSRLIITGEDSLLLSGAATVFNDLLNGAEASRTGVVAPSTGTGFRGDANVYMTTFIHTQADELQFSIQFGHGWAYGTTFFPHVHFCPTVAGGANNAAQFILAYRFANINEQFAAGESTFTMTKTWTGDKSWYHYIAENAAGITVPSGTLSAIMKCRVYRNNAVANNLAGSVAVLFFDWHIELDRLGSRTEYAK